MYHFRICCFHNSTMILHLSPDSLFSAFFHSSYYYSVCILMRFFGCILCIVNYISSLKRRVICFFPLLLLLLAVAFYSLHILCAVLLFQFLFRIENHGCTKKPNNFLSFVACDSVFPSSSFSVRLHFYLFHSLRCSLVRSLF